VVEEGPRLTERDGGAFYSNDLVCACIRARGGDTYRDEESMEAGQVMGKT